MTCTKKSLATRNWILSAHNTAEDLEFLDTPIYSYTCACGDHTQIDVQDYNTHCECTINYSFTHVSLVQNVAHVKLFSSITHEFLNRENFC